MITVNLFTARSGFADPDPRRALSIRVAGSGSRCWNSNRLVRRSVQTRSGSSSNFLILPYGKNTRCLPWDSLKFLKFTQRLKTIWRHLWQNEAFEPRNPDQTYFGKTGSRLVNMTVNPQTCSKVQSNYSLQLRFVKRSTYAGWNNLWYLFCQIWKA